MWCKGRARCKETMHSAHFNIGPHEQSLHLMIPGAIPQLAHVLWCKKSPKLSCRRASSKKAVLNSIHSVSRFWHEFHSRSAWKPVRHITHCSCGVSLPFRLYCRLFLRPGWVLIIDSFKWWHTVFKVCRWGWMRGFRSRSLSRGP